MTVQGGGRLTIDGDVTIYIEREMRYDNGTSANPSAKPSNLKLNVGQGPVNIQGGHDLHAALYAPEAEVIIENNARFYGSIIGRTLTAGGGAQFALRRITFYWRVKRWTVKIGQLVVQTSSQKV